MGGWWARLLLLLLLLQTVDGAATTCLMIQVTWRILFRPFPLSRDPTTPNLHICHFPSALSSDTPYYSCLWHSAVFFHLPFKRPLESAPRSELKLGFGCFFFCFCTAVLLLLSPLSTLSLYPQNLLSIYLTQSLALSWNFSHLTGKQSYTCTRPLNRTQ
jgi:hypothetical protein